MKIIHVEGGLGNQMACYSVYVAAKKAHPNEDFYIDTYVYDIAEAHGTISMWNGYELEKVFGIAIPDIRSLFAEEQVAEQIMFMKNSRFWERGWNYSVSFIDMMKQYGIHLENANQESTTGNQLLAKLKKTLKKTFTETTNNSILYRIKKVAYPIYKRINSGKQSYLLSHNEGDCYYDMSFDFMRSPQLIQCIGDEVRSGFKFSEPSDPKNSEMIRRAQSTNSVSVHIRRTDYLQFNEDCYSFGYFKNATAYIKNHVIDPVFFIFSDDMQWCKNNLSTIGLNCKDEVVFVEINEGENSFRDMQIMTNCKHNIATKSSFGWWGSFLNSNPNKIVCMQMSEYVATNYF